MPKKFSLENHKIVTGSDDKGYDISVKYNVHIVK